MIKHKFHAKPTDRDGIKFASRKEARYYDQLLLAKQSGDLLFFLRQVPFHLPGNTKYVVDFVLFWADQNVEFVDVKGHQTEMFKLKKKQVEDLYPIEITIV
jgi:hypothetical protein